MGHKMKRLLILIFYINFNILAQVDYPTQLSSSNEWAEYSWVKFESEDLLADEFQIISNQIDNSELTELNKFKLFIITNHIMGTKSLFNTTVGSQQKIDLVTFLAVNDMYTEDLSMSKSLSDIVSAKKREISLIKNNGKLTTKDVKSIINFDSSISSYRNGEYNRTVRVFLLCREDRHYPCLFILKDIYGDLVRRSDGLIWSLPALAKSKRGISYNKTNGDTPAGVHQMDSVMLEANRKLSFGKFRRIILNWINGNFFEEGTLSFLPKDQSSKLWWREAIIARDVGRKYLRIHGTGRINKDSKSTFYPHVPTSGCISTLEGLYDGVNYEGQREILEEILKASQLLPVYSNEVNISGILYVLELGSKESAVTIKDLKEIGIE